MNIIDCTEKVGLHYKITYRIYLLSWRSPFYQIQLKLALKFGNDRYERSTKLRRGKFVSLLASQKWFAAHNITTVLHVIKC